VPAFRNRVLNPYNALLYESLADVGVAVEECTFRTLIGRRYDIVHVHWPEYLFSAPTTVRALAQAGAFVVAVSFLAARRTRIVWTVHNLAAHETSHPRLEKRMWRWFVNRVDAYIALTSSGREAAIARYPALEDCPGFVIPHGHYLDVYPASADRGTARRELGLEQHQRVVCFFGSIRPYKGVPTLIHAFRAVRHDDWRLLIAGNAPDDDLLVEIERLAASDPRIRINAGFVPDEQVQHYLRAADLVVLPYRDILNSGSAILALSFGAPVLVPALGAANDLLAQVGPAWIRTYEGELTAQVLEAAMEWTLALQEGARPPLDALDWSRIAALTSTAFEVVRQMPPRHARQPMAAD
jgi:glycosyltransferase involved in cell wall biosynthesis